MLWDSLAAPAAGYHAEQVEIRFSRSVDAARVISAWRETVGTTAALRIAFLVEDENSEGWESVTPGGFLTTTEPFPVSWESWLDADRRRPLLFPQAVPWRAVFWAEEMRFVWTFHHALLDGRSIARVLKNFLKRMNGEEAGVLEISKWQPPSGAMKSAGDALFRRIFAKVETIQAAPLLETAGDSPAVRLMGNDFGENLESRAAATGVTAATLLIEAWGKALARAANTRSIVVEQLRSGPPQPGTAGFTMNLLPLHLGQGNPRGQLLDLRRIESMGPEDFSPGVFPDVEGQWNSVIMIERGTLAHQVEVPDFVEVLTLHECKGRSLAATAHLMPDFRLEVEGPGRHELLDAWIGILSHGG